MMVMMTDAALDWDQYWGGHGIHSAGGMALAESVAERLFHYVL
jgi:hypothetical protein